MISLNVGVFVLLMTVIVCCIQFFQIGSLDNASFNRNHYGWMIVTAILGSINTVVLFANLIFN